jgi:hypothetical protein
VRDTVKKMQRMGAAMGRIGGNTNIDTGAGSTVTVVRLGWPAFWLSAAWVIAELVRLAA